MNLDLESIERDLSKLAEVEQETGIDGYDDIIVDEYNDDADDKYNDNDTSNNNSLDTTNLFGVPDIADVWKKNKKG